MKKILAILAATVIATASFGDILINWRAVGGFYRNGQFGVEPGGYLLNPSGSTFAQLIWTPFNGGSPTINDVDLSDIAGGYTGGDDVLLDTYNIVSPPSASYASYANGAEVYLNSTYIGQIPGGLQGGYVFARIFQDSTPGGGEYYFDSAPLLATAYTGSEGVQLLEHNNDNNNGNELNKFIAVPEPSVLAFLGAGALVVAIRRMRKA